MNKDKLNKALEIVRERFSNWNEITGAIPEQTSTYYEIESMIEDAVHIGIQMWLYGHIWLDENDQVITNGDIPDNKPFND